MRSLMPSSRKPGAPARPRRRARPEWLAPVARWTAGAAVLATREAAPLFDWSASAATHHGMMRRLYDTLTHGGRSPVWQESFERFVHEGGDALHRHACFEAIHAHRWRTTGSLAGWRDWPTEWRAPATAAVAGFAR